MTYSEKYKHRKFYLRIPLIILSLILSLTLFANDSFQGTNDNDEISDESKPNDESITKFIQTEMIVQDGVNWNDIDVETKEGIVTLSGKVDNLLEKDRSINIAKSIRGVRAVIDKLKVRKVEISDQQLKKDVEAALFIDPATDSYELEVDVKNGKITLSGEVDSWQEKELAVKVVKGVRGVQALENEVYFAYNNSRDDIEIKSDITQTLHWDIRVDDALIDVKVSEGNVSLSGTAGSASEHSQAVINSWVAGVKNVDASKLRIADWSKDEQIRSSRFVQKEDDAIEKAVRDAFLYDPRVISFNPEVNVTNGKVVLTGVVSNLKAKRAAEIDARNVVGVWKVENLLKVKGKQDLATDLAIINRVNQALSLNPYLDNYNVNVTAKNGIVTLDGNVENFYEKYKAEDVASTVYGVKKIKNKIDVEFDALPYAYDYNDWFYQPYARSFINSYSPIKSDWEIKNNIEAQLWWSPFINLSDVSIEVDNGIAILEGKVDSWNEYYLAEKNAFEGGALGVDNDLDIEQ